MIKHGVIIRDLLYLELESAPAYSIVFLNPSCGWALGKARVQQIPDNHTMLNHTTLLFAPNLPGIKWNVTNFALIMAQKALIITQFLSSFLHLIFPFISFCQPESI